MQRIILIFGLVLLTLSCAFNGQRGQDDGTAPSTDTASALSQGETCDAGAPANTINGNGDVRSANGNYNPAGCFRGYKVDLNSYNPGPLGALAAYAAPAPTTETQCTATRLRTIVWRRNADGTNTVVGDSSKRGAWITSAFGGMRCATPSVDLTTFLGTSLTQGASYRVVMQAKIEGPLPGTDDDVFQPVLLSVPAPLADVSAPGMLQAMNGLRAQLLAQPSSAIHPIVQSLWAVRGMPKSLGMFCRSNDIIGQIYQINAVALKKIVAPTSASLVDQRVINAQTIHDYLCNDPFPSASDISALQSAVLADLQWGADMTAAVQSFLNIGNAEAAQLIAESLMIDMQRIASRCGASLSEITNFVQFGTAPAGKVGANLLQRNCSGTPTQIAGTTGISANTGDVRTKMRACLDAQSAALSTDSCSGPISEAPAPGAPPPPPPPQSPPPPQQPPDCGSSLVWDPAGRTCVPPDASDAVRQELIQESANYEESARRAHIKLAEFKVEVAASTFFAVGSAGLVGTGVGTPGAVVGAWVAVGFAGIALFDEVEGVLANRSAINSLNRICDITYDHDPRCSGRPQNRCVEFDLQGQRAWFQTGSDGRSFPDGREMTRGDLFQDCSCQLFEKDYRQSAFQFGGPVSWCSQSPEERTMMDCLRNPEDSRGAPKKECIRLLQPKEVDRNAMTSRWCFDKMPNCSGAYLDDTGACACPGGIGSIPASGPPSCANAADAINCGPDGYFDEATCTCASFNSGLGCAKGGLAGYLSKTPTDVFVATFPTEGTLGRRNFLMTAPGNTEIVTGEVLRAGLKDRTQLSLAVRLPTPTVASRFQGWAAQISCTNLAAGVQNRSITTLQFQNLAAGYNTLNFALTAADRTACFNNDLSAARFSIRTNNQAGQPRIGFEDFTVTNQLFDRAGSFLPDPCKTPAPATPIGPRPDPVPFTSIFTLSSAWRFLDGTTLLDVVRR